MAADTSDDGAARTRPPADAVVVAAGSSRRMGGVDKLAVAVAGRPLLHWTLAALRGAGAIDLIILVTTPERVVELRADADVVGLVSDIVAGGATRQESVAAGVRHLAALDPNGADRPVLVHDGARPLVTPGLVAAVAAATLEHGAALPVLPIAETVKRVGEGMVLETVDRSALATAQTPQGMRRRLLLEAWDTFAPDGPRQFTDEASLLEACRIPVHAIPGDPANLKVTMPADLRRVEGVLAPWAARVGFGHDSHPFGPGSPLRLGGIEIPGAPRLSGHSDGDVALHAVADALLGASGMGDLGRLFPADATTPRGIASQGLLREVVAQLGAAGLRPESIDLVVIGARPKLAARLDEMRAAIAAILELDETAVNVKASTGNLAGDEGAGRTISARAIATVVSRGA